MKYAIIFMSLLSILPLRACAEQNSNAHITSFSYHFDGTIGGNSHNYQVRVENGKATLTVYDMEHHDYGDMTDTVGADFVLALEQLCAKHEVNRYDGFDKYNEFVSDGTGFSLYIKYDDGKSVSAHGMNKFPSGYREFSNEMHALFQPYCERLCEAALQKKKAAGVSGDLTFIMMNFIQDNSVNGDRYEVMISRPGIRSKNVEVRIHSVSGEFFPAGDYTIYEEVPDKLIDWKAYAKLVKKHDLVQWMDYHKSAGDGNKNEWFQMSFDFEEGHIDAMGSAHPEHYDAFRADFMKLLRKTVDGIQKHLTQK